MKKLSQINDIKLLVKRLAKQIISRDSTILFVKGFRDWLGALCLFLKNLVTILELFGTSFITTTLLYLFKVTHHHYYAGLPLLERRRELLLKLAPAMRITNPTTINTKSKISISSTSPVSSPSKNTVQLIDHLMGDKRVKLLDAIDLQCLNGLCWAKEVAWMVGLGLGCGGYVAFVFNLNSNVLT